LLGGERHDLASGCPAGLRHRRARHHHTTYPGGVHVVNTTFFATVGDETAANGTGTWQWTSGSGPELTATDAAVTTNNGIENIAVIGGDGNLYFYWQYSPGQYTRELVDTSASSDPPGRQRDGSGTIRDG